jgi:hypothetical protein
MRTTLIRTTFACAAVTAAMLGATGIANAEPKNGEAGVCYYNGQSYSEGAKVTLPDGTVQTCQHDGTWGRKIKLSNGSSWRAPLSSGLNKPSLPVGAAPIGPGLPQGGGKAR